MLRLRAADEPDVPVIFQLIGELADYERLRPQMVGAVDDLRRHLFGEPRYAHALMAEWDGAVAGFALYFFNYSTFLCRPGLYLEDLFVLPEQRGRGIGKALLIELARRARAADCGRMEWAVLDWNESAIRFYEGLGARPIDEWRAFRLTRDAIGALADGQAPAMPG